MKIIVGLGNFGDKYAYTYHNLGFLTAEAIADKLGFAFKKRQCDASIAKGYISGQPIIIARPLTFMNLSGVAVLQLLKKHRADISDLLVIYDDIDIEKGKLRFRQKGSAGTHNGMRNIIQLLSSGDFARLRIGIGPVPTDIPVADYVLSQVPKAERQLFYDTINQAADKAIDFVKND